MKLWVVDPEYLSTQWPIAAPFLQRAIDESHGEITLEEIRKGVSLGEYGVIAVYEGDVPIAAVAIEVRNHPNKRVLYITLAGGSRSDEWVSLVVAEAERYARQFGCSSVYISGRRGWVKKLANEGFHEYYTVIGKEVIP